LSVLEKHLEPARAQLSQDAVMAAEHAGQAMTLQQLIADALNLECTGVDEPDVQHSPLTARQQEVAALIARGLSNRQIAEELVIAEYTAERHVHHILTKLGLTSRTQVAAWAFEHTAARHI
jgi:non-specific serine/threonine protein kinase